MKGQKNDISLKIYLSMPFEGWKEQQLLDYIELEHTRLKNIFRNYNIEFHDRREIRATDNFDKGLPLLKACDICAMAETWIYSNDCKKEREIAVENGKPIVITNSEYSNSFIRDYIVGKVLNK